MSHGPSRATRWGEESVHIWFITHLFLLTLPRRRYSNVTPMVCSVEACLLQQCGHSLAIHRVCFIMVVAFRQPWKKQPWHCYAVRVFAHHPSTESFHIRFSRPLTSWRIAHRFLADSQVSNWTDICRNGCAYCGRKCFSSRRRVFHPVGMSCISAHMYRALASYLTIDPHVSSPRILVTTLSW